MQGIVDALNNLTNGLIQALQSVVDWFNALLHLDQSKIIDCTKVSSCSLTWSIIFAFLLFVIRLTGFAYTTLLERQLLSYLQQRIGPNRAGPFGFLQPAADGLKLIFKEDVTPVGADKGVFLLAPVMKTVPALLVVAVIPLGPPLVPPWVDGNWYRWPLVLGNVNVGVPCIRAWLRLWTVGCQLAVWSAH